MFIRSFPLFTSFVVLHYYEYKCLREFYPLFGFYKLLLLDLISLFEIFGFDLFFGNRKEIITIGQQTVQRPLYQLLMSTLCHSMCLTITLSSTIDTNRSFSVLIYSSPILISIYDYSGYGASTDMTILTVYFPENHPCFLKLIYVELNLLMGLFNYLLLVGLSDYYLPISINFFLYFA